MIKTNLLKNKFPAKIFTREKNPAKTLRGKNFPPKNWAGAHVLTGNGLPGSYERVLTSSRAMSCPGP